MPYYLTSISLALAILIAYLTIFTFNLGLPTSLSATYYHCQKKWLFPTVLGLTAALTAVPILELTPEPWKFLGFFVLASVLFTASAPAFKEDFVGKVHTWSALIGSVAALCWIVVILGWGGAIIPAFGLIIAIIDRKRAVLWVEISILTGLFFGLYYSIFQVLTLPAGA